MYLLYGLGLGVFFLGMLPGVLAQMLFRGKYRRGLRERLGRVLPWEGAARPIWLHAVSVGEAMAAAPLAKELRARHPEIPLLVSTATETGRKVAEQRLPAERFVFFPLDFGWAVDPALDRLRPRLILLTETELWPNFLAACTARGVAVAMVNGRISPRSFRRYRLARRWLDRILRDVRLFCMQSREDAERILALGALPERVRVTGNIKFDLPAGEVSPEEIRQTLGLPPGCRLVVGGSTHRGEEEALLAAFKGALASRPDLCLLLAPRHPERLDEVERLVARFDLGLRRRSRLPGSPLGTTRVILLDTVGELARLYAAAQVVFIGGSLIPHGGQNLLEPAAHGRPVLHGPFMHNFAEMRSLFDGAGAAIQIQDAEDLRRHLEALLDDPDRADRMGGVGREILEAHRGATRRTADLVESLL
jgi:3-deoxy-D-manno-octulosonic-acid transferase